MIGIKEKATGPDGKSSRVLQNPSVPGAGYDGHMGLRYQLQLAQSYGDNEAVCRFSGCFRE